MPSHIYNTMKITIIAHPNSKNPRIEIDMLKNIHVYVKEPAKAGKANKAIIKAIANYYSVPKSSVTLLQGARNKNKMFKILTE
jgi:uncharacterized protein (TIGR00251 family)